ncbi:hypothetical protein S1361_02520 [Streptomyces cyanogenus]|uniref:Uncharacterized protein n=1 Tax=Streptomyces cyanogenus TaxID=80860 RepID=A0ABX7TIU9_STRCY|nr:hypothetical protein S1361_02520 [Streptomyces cyanogenus]
MLLLVVLGPLTARYTEPLARRLTGHRNRRTAPATETGPDAVTPGQTPAARP